MFITYMSAAICLEYSDELLQYYHANIISITATIMFLNAFMLGSYYARHKLFIVGSTLLVVGFVCKITTIYFDQYWGTSIFHILTAAGIAVLLPIMDEKNAYEIIQGEPGVPPYPLLLLRLV